MATKDFDWLKPVEFKDAIRALGEIEDLVYAGNVDAVDLDTVMTLHHVFKATKMSNCLARLERAQEMWREDMIREIERELKTRAY